MEMAARSCGGGMAVAYLRLPPAGEPLVGIADCGLRMNRGQSRRDVVARSDRMMIASVLQRRVPKSVEFVFKFCLPSRYGAMRQFLSDGA
jgi:hypothetical protein